MTGHNGLNSFDLRLMDPVDGPASLREDKAITDEYSQGQSLTLNESSADPAVRARKLQAVAEAFAAVGIE